MGKAFGKLSGLTLLPGAEITEGQDYSLNGRAIYEGDVAAFAAPPLKGSPHPRNRNLICFQAKTTWAGLKKVRVEADYIGIDVSPTPYFLEFCGSVGEQATAQSFFDSDQGMIYSDGGGFLYAQSFYTPYSVTANVFQCTSGGSFSGSSFNVNDDGSGNLGGFEFDQNGNVDGYDLSFTFGNIQYFTANTMSLPRAWRCLRTPFQALNQQRSRTRPIFPQPSPDSTPFYPPLEVSA